MRKETTKESYKTMVILILILGLVGNVIFSTVGIFYEFDYYAATYMAISLLVVGFAMGLAYARSWKIRGIDK